MHLTTDAARRLLVPIGVGLLIVTGGTVGLVVAPTNGTPAGVPPGASSTRPAPGTRAGAVGPPPCGARGCQTGRSRRRACATAPGRAAARAAAGRSPGRRAVLAVRPGPG